MKNTFKSLKEQLFLFALSSCSTCSNIIFLSLILSFVKLYTNIKCIKKTSAVELLV